MINFRHLKEVNKMAKLEKFKLPSGESVDGEQVEINQSSEHWNQYLLEDGSVLKLKSVATKIVRLKDQYDPIGNPVYFLQSNNVVTVDSPEELKKRS